MGKKNPKLLRIGDTAIVKNPQRVYRCGYNLTPKIAVEKLLEEHNDDIVNFLETIGIGSSLVTEMNFRKTPSGKAIKQDDYTVSKFLNSLGYLYTNKKGFGGNERKLFKSDLTSINEGDTVTITDVTSTYTGVYYGPSGGITNTGDSGYE